MYDYLIRDALVYDGSGEKPYKSNVAIFGDRIALIGNEKMLRAKDVIDGKGMILTPGFIDIHTHTDLLLLRDPDMKPRISQGITTDLSGNCGIGVFPNSGKALETAVGDVLGEWNDWAWRDYSSYKAYALKDGIAINEAFLVSHTAIRLAVMGENAGRAATEDEIDRMCTILDSLLSGGCWGFSTGLYYAPCLFAEHEELKRLLEIVKRHNRLFAVHHRCEGNDIIQSLQEVLDLAKETGVRLEISHLKAIGIENQSKVPVILSMIENARNDGVDVRFDQYPYTYGSTSLFSLLPPHILSLSRFEQRLALSLENERDELKNEILHPDGWDSIYEMAGPDNIRALYLESHMEYSGKTLSEIAESRNADPLDALFDILSEETGLAVMTDITESEENLIRIMKHPLASFGSDSLYSSPIPHPRSLHGAVEYLSTYVIGKGVLSLEDGIRRMTGENATRIGLERRGFIREGYYADLLLVSPEKLKVNDSGNNGIEMVMVNGEIVKEGEKLTGRRPGRIL